MPGTIFNSENFKVAGELKQFIKSLTTICPSFSNNEGNLENSEIRYPFQTIASQLRLYGLGQMRQDQMSLTITG